MAAPKVNDPCPAYLEMARHWDMVDDLMGGTLRMQEVALQSEKWLPRFAHEEPDQYRKRVEISVLYNALADTVSQLTAKPFSEPLSLGGELPPKLAALEANADRAGRSLHSVARWSFEDACKYGLTHLQIDMAEIADAGPRPTIEDQVSGRSRPSIIPRSAKDVIGWKSTTDADGAHALTQVRIREFVEVDDGPWGTKTVEQILVLNAPRGGKVGTWERYREGKERAKDWILHSKGTHRHPGVPLVTWYTKQTGFMTALPPLEDLACLNVRHWQSGSDQARILSFARAAAMVLLAGLRPEEMKDSTIAFMRIIRSTSEVASATMIEHSGKAVEAGEKDLEKIEQRMVTLGQQPFTELVSDATATGVKSQGSKTRTLIQMWIADEEVALNAALAIAAWFQNVDLPGDVKADIHSDFVDFGGAAAEHDSLLRARQARQITQATYLRESKRRRFYSEALDVDAEVAETQAEGPPLSFVTAGGAPGPGGGAPPKAGTEPSPAGPAGARQAA